MFSFFLFHSFEFNYPTSSYEYYDGTEHEIIITADQAKSYNPNFIVFYEYDDDATFNYTTDLTCQTNPDCVLKMHRIKDYHGFFAFETTLYGKVNSELYVRIGSIPTDLCINGGYVTNNPYFDIADYINQPDFLSGQVRCVGIACDECTTTITRGLKIDTLYILSKAKTFAFPGASSTTTYTSSATHGTFIVIKKAASTDPRTGMTATTTFTKTAAPSGDEICFVNTSDKDTYTKELPDPTPFRTLINTYSSTVPATWDGEYEDEPGIIIRGDDNPEIRDTHYPIQTKYIKTDVPKGRAAANITIGTVTVITILSITVINIVYSARKVTGKGEDEINEDDFDTDDDELGSFDSESEADHCDEPVAQNDIFTIECPKNHHYSKA